MNYAKGKPASYVIVWQAMSLIFATAVAVLWYLILHYLTHTSDLTTGIVTGAIWMKGWNDTKLSKLDAKS